MVLVMPAFTHCACRRATAEFATAVDLDPSQVSAWNLLGLCRTSMGDIREGVKAYERALSLDPSMREAWVNLGQALKEEVRGGGEILFYMG